MVIKQRFKEYSHSLAWQAVDACFDGKWQRDDVLNFAEKYGGFCREALFGEILDNNLTLRNEVTDSIAYFVDEMVECILNGKEIDEMEPVVTEQRPDGMTGKVREIANLCIPHQLLGHVVKLGLDEFLHARILPQQHASIPRHGQTMLKEQMTRYLRSSSLDIRYVVKTDVKHDYGTTKYSSLIQIIEEELPKAKWIIAVLRYLEKWAPDGHLIIGGYLDAWLFNLAMSYVIRDVLEQKTVRRGVEHRWVSRVSTYMDDFALLGRTKTGLKKAIKYLDRRLHERFGMELKQTSSILKIESMEEERERKKQKRPSKRGCNSVDMGGFMIHRSYVTMRPRVEKRVARAFSRAYEEYRITGTIQKQRAQTLIARYGSVVQTNSDGFKHKYHVDEVMKIAKKVTAYHARQRSKRNRRWMRGRYNKHKSTLERLEQNESGGKEHVCNYQNALQAA